DFLKEEFRKRKRLCAVLGISGGIDSALAAFLCKKAGLELYLVSMPYGKLDEKDNAKKIARKLNLPKNRFIEINITEIINESAKEIQMKISIDRTDKGNIMARTRMIILYSIARKLNGLVIGTENLSEYWLGYFTLYGDEASDINPIAKLWKTQVWKLAEYLKMPNEILEQEPSAELWKGQTDEKEFGFTYREADPILYLSCIKKYSKRKIIKNYGFDANLVELVLKRVKATCYKRCSTPAALI
ncbi:MAG: NAD(+) synthase, partial [Candidatus Aenigmarchaeota archaeon]|nr:NAD(+) synthase [Candidatus Aenigmarchaeota archaeon]